MSETFYGRGLGFPLRLGVTGLDESAGVAQVEESIRIILGTQYGERVMRPRFGCNLKSLAFAPNTDATANLARYYVTEGLTRWEPRIEVVDVSGHATTTRRRPADRDHLPAPGHRRTCATWSTRSTWSARHDPRIAPRPDRRRPNLDDRTWQDLVDEMRALIPTYAPQWTDHNPSDLGITLIELFAWLAEGVIYRLNQTPGEELHRLPQPARHHPRPADPRAHLPDVHRRRRRRRGDVPAGTQAQTAAARGETPIVFETDEDVARAADQPQRAAVEVGPVPTGDARPRRTSTSPLRWSGRPPRKHLVSGPGQPDRAALPRLRPEDRRRARAAAAALPCGPYLLRRPHPGSPRPVA